VRLSLVVVCLAGCVYGDRVEPWLRERVPDADGPCLQQVHNRGGIPHFHYFVGGKEQDGSLDEIVRPVPAAAAIGRRSKREAYSWAPLWFGGAGLVAGAIASSVHLEAHHEATAIGVGTTLGVLGAASLATLLTLAFKSEANWKAEMRSYNAAAAKIGCPPAPSPELHVSGP
jgi:hypothetical protein